MANEIVTVSAKRKISRALAEGLPLPRITHMAIGSGGTDTDGTPIPPSELAEALRQTIDTLPVDSIVYQNGDMTTTRYTVILTLGKYAGVAVNELALVDADGGLYCVKTFGDKVKDADMEMELSLDLAF